MADRLEVFNTHFQQVKFQNAEVQRVATRTTQSQFEAISYLMSELKELQELQKEKAAIQQKRMGQTQLI